MIAQLCGVVRRAALRLGGGAQVVRSSFEIESQVKCKATLNTLARGCVLRSKIKVNSLAVLVCQRRSTYIFPRREEETPHGNARHETVRPDSDKSKRARPIGLSLNDNLLVRVDEAVQALRISRSEFVRRAIERELAQPPHSCGVPA